ncbi:MAG: SGNH/GDSL hydrolase family protein [Opitutaceae bacterium]|nr:SGNH/GDSL hydrolase family protein [Opitutaceae bacterium]
MTWHNAAQAPIEGRAWNDTPTPFNRLPARAQKTVTKAIWRLSQNSAGLNLRFRTDAPQIHVRHTVANDLVSANMTPIARSGLDLYARDPAGHWRWAAVAQPNIKTNDKHLEKTLLDNPAPGTRDYRLYLPLYNTTTALEIGVPQNSAFTWLPPPAQKTILYYGTSIAHGASASRPGMTIPAILGRRLDTPVINLGLSGNGKMEPAMARLIAEIDAALYILDCLPNMSALAPDEISARLENTLRHLRKTHPQTPIILLEDRTYAHAWLFPRLQEKHQKARAAQRATYEKLLAEGMTRITYIEGATLFGDDDEGMIDGSHPNELGITRQVAAMLPALRRALGQ